MGLYGWSGGMRAGARQDAVMDGMSAAIRPSDERARRRVMGPFGALGTTSRPSDVFESDAQLAAIWGHARFTEPELSSLADRHGTAQALAEGYARRRSDVFKALAGDFALALVSREETVIAVDRIGTRSLVYVPVGDALVFASTLDALDAFPGVTREVDRQAIYDYVYFHMIPAPRTIYAGRRRLLPGTFLRWRNGSAETQSYWQMRFIEDQRRPFPELKAAFRSVLRESVRQAAADGPTGAFLSGGTDSSTIAGLLGDVTGEPARTYSIGFDAEGYDEMNYARVAAQHFKTRHHEYYVTPDDVVTAVPLIAQAHDQPFGNASAVPAFYCARLAREDGIETLLGGDGGDELFGGNERYAKQYLYSLYSDLPRALRNYVIEPLAFLPPEVSIIGKAQRYMRNAVEPMPARYDNYNLVGRLGADNIFTAEFLDGVDLREPQREMANVYNSAHAGTLINRMLALDLKYTLADNDLPKVVRSCELAGVDVRFPMLEDAVVAFSATLAPGLKLKGTRLRYFFKEALRDYLPKEIITKQKHGFGLPFGTWLRTHSRLQQLAADSLVDIRARGIVQPNFVDQLLGTHVTDHPAYYGTMVWVLMMLEQWFRQHASHEALTPS